MNVGDRVRVMGGGEYWLRIGTIRTLILRAVGTLYIVGLEAEEYLPATSESFLADQLTLEPLPTIEADEPLITFARTEDQNGF